MTSCNLKIGITSPVRVKSFFTFKGKFPKILFSGLVYKRKCGGCNATYYSKTKRHFKVRIWEHLGISYLNGKKVKIDNIELTTIQEHFLCCNYSPSFEDFSVLTKESNYFRLEIMGSVPRLTVRDKPDKTDYSLSFELFDNNNNGYHLMFYLIFSYDIPSCLCNFRLFSFRYYVINFTFLSKAECMSIYYHFRRDHESSDFSKNQWFCRKMCYYFLD